MPAHALTETASASSTRYPHPLMNVFAQAKRGSLRVVAPDGIVYDLKGTGPGAEAEIRLQSWAPLDALLLRGDLGFGESFMEREWTTPDLTAVLTFGLANNDVMEHYLHGRSWYAVGMWARALLHSNTRSGSRRNVKAHYDLGNDFYKLWLDDSMTYSGAFFNGDYSKTLEEAQQAKYDRILDKLNAEAGDHILEIGCGWGGFAEAAARRNLYVTGVTLSEEQAAYACERLKLQHLDSLAAIELCDYREVKGQYDHVVSIGMFEHVGRQFWPTFFHNVQERLRPGGRAMIQSIVIDESVFQKNHAHYGFMEHYIFPGGELATRTRIREEAWKAGLTCAEQFTFGLDYAQTLREWKKRFEENLPAVRALGYDDRFIRMWDFYLCACIASFSTGRTDLTQNELVKPA